MQPRGPNLTFILTFPKHCLCVFFRMLYLVSEVAPWCLLRRPYFSHLQPRFGTCGVLIVTLHHMSTPHFLGFFSRAKARFVFKSFVANVGAE
jgi:hypothetical protein